MSTMKAARFHAASKILIEDISKPPPPSSSEFTVSVLWGGICGTDLHEYICGPLVINTPDRPHNVTGDHLPLTVGHEFMGRISALPDNYSGDLTLGTPVMVDPRFFCGECNACKAGNDNLCSHWGFLGLNGGGGGGAGFSEYVNVAQRMCHSLPNDGSVDLNNAVLIEPLTVGRHALAASGHQDFSELNVLISGGGPVGLAVAFNLRAVGVGRVFVSEPTSRRRGMIGELGLAKEEDVFNPLIVNVAEEVRGRTKGRGVDIVFDCAGIPAALKVGMDSLRIKGTYVNVAGWEQPLVVPLGLAMMKEITIKFSMAYDNQDFTDVVADFVAGKFAGAEKMITSRIYLDDLTVKGFDELLTKKDEHVKIVATPRKGLLS